MLAPSRWSLWLAAACTLVGFAGCIGTSVGNPPGAKAAQFRLNVVGTIEEEPTVSLKVAGGITLTEAWIVLRDFDMRKAGDCSVQGEDDDGLDAPGTFVADLIHGTVLPEAPIWQRDAGESYCELRTEVEASGEAIPGAPSALSDNGVLIRGTRADGTPFEMRINLNEELRLGSKGKGEFKLGEGPVSLLITFNLNAWFNPGLLDKAVATNGTIIVDEKSNKELADSVAVHIPESARLLRDKNKDGKLDTEDEEL